jgi:hypothetical protein
MMAKEIEITGTNTEEKFKSLERIISHLAKRSNKAVGVFVPPSLISAYIEQPYNGNIYKQLFPVSGKLSNVCMLVDTLPDKVANVDIEITLKYPNATGEKILVPGKKVLQQSMISKSIPAGTIISVDLVNKDMVCSGIWLAGLFTIDINNAKLQTVVASELEETYARLQKDISVESGIVEEEKPSSELSDVIAAFKS